MSKITSYRKDIPVIRKEMKLAKCDNFTGIANDFTIITFEKTVNWLIETTSKIKFLHEGVELKEGSEYSDFYGYLSCIDEESISEIDRLKKRYKINEKSTLEIVLELNVNLIPLLDCEVENSFNSLKNYYILPNRITNYKEEITELYWTEKDIAKKTELLNKEEVIFIESKNILSEFVYSTKKGNLVDIENLKEKINILAKEKLIEWFDN